MTRLRLLVAALAGLLLLALPAAVGASAKAPTVLIGSVGTAGAPDAFRITLTDANGNAVSRVPAGDYEIQVHDYATIHNFHFFGPGGITMNTEIETASTATWDFTLVNGTYNYQCDAHPLQLHGTLAVGPPPPPPPPPTKLTASVATGGKVTLKKAGVALKSLPKGRYVITVADGSKTENFHLTGPGVNAKTTLLFKGAKRLAVTLKAGKYRYRSDAHPKLAKTLTAT